MRRVLFALSLFVVSAVGLGCTATQRGALVGGTIGAATGAMVGGAAFGEPGVGALVGAGMGAATGALIADAAEECLVGCPPGYVSVPHARVRPRPHPRTPDPTRGRIINSTPWEVHLFVHGENRYSPLIIPPRGRAVMHLDIGEHTLVSRAYVSTAFGPRLVGENRHTIVVDPRAYGWTLRITEDLF